MSETMLDLLRKRAEHICEDGVQLLDQFSGMHPVNSPYDSLVLISVEGNHFWNKLPVEGKQIQSKLLPEIDRFTDLVNNLSQNLPSSSKQEIKNILELTKKAIEQNSKTWWKTKEEAVSKFRELFTQFIAILSDYYKISLDDVIVVPDTNAFLSNPEIESWRFKEIKHFTIILTPTILSELDEHKINHKNLNIRDNATKIIRKIKEYRRRGSINEGVVIVTGLVSLKSIASEPNMLKSLSWLDPNNADDRFLASTLEIIRSNLGYKVFIITSDINLQNKAEIAGIPFCEVP
jgi:rRNA-processing protein FCF1